MRSALLAALLSCALCSGARAGEEPSGVLAQVARSPVVSRQVIGHSTQGRPLELLVAADPNTIRGSAPSVLLICGQHGNEPVAPRAALDVLAGLASGEQRGILDRVVLLVAPYANPDGLLAGRRANAAGVDLNRDWRDRTQPETQAIFDAFLRWRPMLVIDAHEWAPGDAHAFNSVEVPLLSPGGAAPAWVQPLGEWVSTALAASARSGIYVQRTHWSAANDPRLAHRYFAGAWGIPAILYETMPAGSVPATARVRAAATFLSQMLAAVAATVPAPSPPPPPRRESEPPQPLWPGSVALAAGLLMVLLLAQGQGGSDGGPSPFALRRRRQRVVSRDRYPRRGARSGCPLRRPSAQDARGWRTRATRAASPSPVPRRARLLPSRIPTGTARRETRPPA